MTGEKKFVQIQLFFRINQSSLKIYTPSEVLTFTQENSFDLDQNKSVSVFSCANLKKKTYRACQKRVSVTFHWSLLLCVQFAISITLNICTVVTK
jgi:hypothetical protein